MENPDINDEIIAKIKKLEKSKSAAVRNRVTKALKVLEENCILPKGWSKIERLVFLVSNRIKLAEI